MSIIAEDIRVGTVRLFRRALGLGAYTFAAVTGAPYARLLGLRAAAERALHRGDLTEATSLANELLRLAERYAKDWYYGNAIHNGHLILGHAALGGGDVAQAREELLAAGRTPGSPQLNSFGPNMHLAKALLEAGEKDVVIEYFELCRKFWQLHSVPASTTGDSTGGRLDRWTAQVEAGEVPDFGPNLVY